MAANEAVDLMALLDGETYVPNDQGEAAVANKNNHVRFVAGDMDNIGVKIATILLMSYDINGQRKHNDDQFSDIEKNIILTMRYYSWQAGLYEPLSNEERAAVHYVEFEELVDDADLTAIIGPQFRRRFGIADGGLLEIQTRTNAHYNAGAAYDDQNIAWYDPRYLGSTRKQYRNIRATVAYIFRARGHHFKLEFLERYHELWAKNTNSPSDAIIHLRNHWEVVATNGLHAIIPSRLDTAWVNDSLAGMLCAPLILRVNVPCAGNAFFYAVLAGIDEACILAPKILIEHAERIAALRAVVDDRRRHRWKGGINRAFYAGENGGVNEADFAILAAVVTGFNTASDNVTDLGKSQSLKRVARCAEITTMLARSAADGVYAAVGDLSLTKAIGTRVLQNSVFMGVEEAKAGD